MKKSLLAAAIVASTLSAPLFAMHESTVELNVELLPAASVQFQENAIEFKANNAQMDDALAKAMMHIGARGAKAGTAKKVDITFTQLGSIPPNLDANKFYLTDDNNHVEMIVDFTPEGGTKTVGVQKGQPIVDMETERGLAIMPSANLNYFSQLDFTIKNHLQYDAGEYSATIKATVAAK